MTPDSKEQHAPEACPFCRKLGNKPIPSDGMFYFQCAGCGIVTGEFETEDEAIKFWNTRPAPQSGMRAEGEALTAALDVVAGLLDQFGGYCGVPACDAAIFLMQEHGLDRWSMQSQMERSAINAKVALPAASPAEATAERNCKNCLHPEYCLANGGCEFGLPAAPPKPAPDAMGQCPHALYDASEDTHGCALELQELACVCRWRADALNDALDILSAPVPPADGAAANSSVPASDDAATLAGSTERASIGSNAPCAGTETPPSDDVRSALFISEQDRIYAKDMLEDLVQDFPDNIEIAAQWFCKARNESLRSAPVPAPVTGDPVPLADHDEIGRASPPSSEKGN